MALKKQMELFDDGGLFDEGGTVDEESGNDVPVGSLKKEVRDDIPAQLSEGEFVMPADVVRYHGLDKMMALRDEAKMGLQRMEDMGQMGNADEATIPDGVPFTIVDLEIVDNEDEPVEMQVGGFVQPTFTPGGVQQSQFAQYQPQFTPYQMPDYTQPTMPAYTPPQQAATPMAPTGVPEFGQFVTPTYVTYVNDAGNTIQIPVGPDGQPLIPVPAGFKKQTDTPDVPDTATPPTTVAPTTVAQPQEDRISPEELAQQQQAQQNIKERKAAAKELGYTKEANPLEGLLKFAIPGASLFMDEPEVGTIMPDGTVADGKGNTFDPRTGKQVGGKGFLGLGKGVAEEFDMEGAAIPEASIAGLRSQAGEQSIQDLLSAVPPTEEKTPTDVGVETARVETAQTTADVDAVVGDVTPAVQEKAKELNQAMKDLGLTDNQRMDYLVTLAEGGPEKVTFGDQLTGPTVDFSKFSPDARTAAQTLISTIESAGNDNIKARLAASRGRLPATADEGFLTPATRQPSAVAAAVDPETDVLPGEPGAEIGSASYRRQRNIETKVNRAKTTDPKQYARDVRAGVYDNDFAALDEARANVRLEQNSQTNNVGTNIRDTYGDDIASQVRDDQGTVGSVDTDTGGIYYDSSHDWSQPTQTNVNDNPSAKAEETAGSRDDKIVCTAMNDAYGFGSFRQTIWLHHSKTMDPAYQRGYHRLFKPLLRIAFKDKKWYNKIIRTSLEGIARRRTADIWLQKKGKRHPIGAIERAILEPLCYIVGKIK
tara:strand:- start:260 stop:2557 length:2298 start_codon:yes stop_codon:yes gene_type:complete